MRPDTQNGVKFRHFYARNASAGVSVQTTRGRSPKALLQQSQCVSSAHDRKASTSPRIFLAKRKAIECCFPHACLWRALQVGGNRRGLNSPGGSACVSLAVSCGAFLLVFAAVSPRSEWEASFPSLSRRGREVIIFFAELITSRDTEIDTGLQFP